MVEQRYRVIERLEAGGMAEVFLGEATSVQGFKKRVAIKRVLPHLSSHTSFIGMFLDEARLGARLNHANVVTVFDIGSADDTYFIVMEYVDGCNLKRVMETLRNKHKPFPLKAAVYIAMEACRGLSYAHELRDDDNHPLDLVHRDVSPPNILISRRGEVKMTDFGLAKARTQLERTDPGVVKGKFSYLSPEAAAGNPVDPRADIFALGVCLWEMLGGRRLFLGDSDYETVQLITDARVPSLVGQHDEVDASFERILSRALSRDPANRYQTARDFGDALAEYLFNRQKKVTPYDIANLVKLAMERHQSIPPQPLMIDKMITEELTRFTSLDSPSMGLSPSDFVFSPDNEGSRPLDAAEFENPSKWFEGDADVQQAIETVRSSAPPNATHGWIDAASAQTKPNMPSSLKVPDVPQRPKLEQPVVSVRAPATPSSAEAASTEPTTSSSSSIGVWTVLSVAVLIAAVAAAWFMLRG